MNVKMYGANVQFVAASHLSQHQDPDMEQMEPGRHDAWEASPKDWELLEGTGPSTAQCSVPNARAA